jgi:D-glycero-beta-D-manno-heptose-7-phosphate kinase
VEERLQELVAAFPGRRVLVVGDVMLDEYLWGDVQRISPEAPVPVVAIRRRTSVPGGAANTAANVASLTGEALLAGVVGDDPPAGRLRAALQGLGLAVEGLIVDRQRSTTTKTRIIAHHQHVVRVDEEHSTPLPGEVEEQVLRWLEDQVAGAHACVLSDYGKGVVSRRLAEHVIGLVRQAGKPVVVDPKGTDYVKYRGATVVKPNLAEAVLVCHQQGGDASTLEGIRRHLLNLLEGSAVLLTRGAEGMSLFERGVAPVHIPSMAQQVYDVTGAGDTVAGTLALALAAGATLPEGATLANRAAGIVVAKVGTAQATCAELLGGAGPA